MAIGLKQQARVGTDTCLTKVYVLNGDGCIMEGTSHRSMHGWTLQLVSDCVHDDNGITIEARLKSPERTSAPDILTYGLSAH